MAVETKTRRPVGLPPLARFLKNGGKFLVNMQPVTWTIKVKKAKKKKRKHGKQAVDAR